MQSRLARAVLWVGVYAILALSPLVIALVGGLVLLAGLTVARDRVRLNYEWWRVTHAVMGVGVLMIGLAHVIQVGHYVALRAVPIA